MTTQRVFIGLGSNLDDPASQVRRAIDELGQLDATHRVASSGLYRSRAMTAPDDDLPQEDYINAVVELRTSLTPEALLDRLLAIEAAHGRERGRRWGERTLDLDILLFGDEAIDTDRLTVPHPGISERDFVLRPLAEIDADLMIPGHGKLETMINSCEDNDLRYLGSFEQRDENA